MGALTDTRKRSLLDHHHRLPTPLSDLSTPSKKPKLFPSSPPSPAAARAPPPPPPPPRTMPPAPRRFPPPAPLRRPVHGPQRILKVLGLGSASFSGSGSQSTAPVLEQRDPGPSANDTLGLEKYRRMVVDVQEETRRQPTPEPVCTPVKELPVVMREPEEVSDLYILDRKVEESGKVVMESVPVREERVVVRETPRSGPLYKDLYESLERKYDSVWRGIEFDLEFYEKKLSSLKSVREAREALKKPTEDLPGPFTPLTDEEEAAVNHALRGGNRREVLVVHKASNIEITREILRCLSYGAWLNDEVINLYLELLKERETREPKRFLKCHFFNSFFYKKLISGRNGYDFKAIKRWTSQKKLGYSLIECDKIFVPIHKEVHWCLAVINVKDKCFQYLDSLGGMDKMALRVLARYLVDEVKDKSDKQIDTISWRQEAVKELPLQENGWDCGMFMLKYSDFYSRGLGLSFGQEHMEYFRKRTIQEILRLRAE